MQLTCANKNLTFCRATLPLPLSSKARSYPSTSCDCTRGAMHLDTFFCSLSIVFFTRSMVFVNATRASSRHSSPWSFVRSFRPSTADSSTSLRSLLMLLVTAASKGPNKSALKTLHHEWAMFRVNGLTNSTLRSRRHDPCRRRASNIHVSQQYF